MDQLDEAINRKVRKYKTERKGGGQESEREEVTERQV